MLSRYAGEASPGADQHDEIALGRGPKANSAPPTSIQSPTKRVMLLIDAKARDYALNKAIRHLRLEGGNYDVLVRLHQYERCTAAHMQFTCMSLASDYLIYLDAILWYVHSIKERLMAPGA